MNKKVLSMLAGALLGGALAGNAVPAKPGMRTIVQPDGTTVEAELRGDEYCSFYVTADGTVMQMDARGYLRYASTDALGAVTLSATPVATADREATIAAMARIGAENRVAMDAVPAAAAARAAMARTGREDLPWTGLGLMNRQNFPTLGNIKSVVILVSYKDVDFTTENPQEYFHNMLNTDGFDGYGAVGSAAQFFRENSMEQFVPTFDVYGPVKLANNRVYYGEQVGTRHDRNAAAMVTEAVAALDATVDFSQYDLDGDGYIDNIYVFYAGQGQATYGGTETVWPHSSTIVNGPVVDGVRVGRYACSNEWEYNRPDGIGTFVHEFSHVMGLPDLYATQYTGAKTPGKWSTMDQGPYNGNGMCPPYYSAYERNALGWIDLKVIDGPASLTINPIQQNEAYIIPGHITNEFFLLECRTKTGWDKSAPSGGMLVWQVNYDPSVFNSNVVNNDPEWQYVNIVEANDPKTGTTVTGEAGYVFPNGFKRSITPTTSPNLQPWTGPVLPVELTNIAYSMRNVTLLVDGGAATIEAPQALEASAHHPGGFTANWTAVEGAAAYYLTVSSELETQAQNEYLPFGENTATSVEIPEGWTFSGVDSDIYTAGTTFYGASGKPSLKFNNNGIELVSPYYEGTVESAEFFLRAITPDDKSLFVIEGRNTPGGAWKILWTNGQLADIKTKGAVFQADLTAAAPRQIKFVYYGTTGKVALDDVTVRLAPTYTGTIDELYRLSAGTDTNLPVSLTPEGTGHYSYIVEAKDNAGLYTPASNRVHVDMTSFLSGVEDVTVDDPNAPVEYYNLQGVRIENPTSGIYIRRQGTDTRKVIIR